MARKSNKQKYIEDLLHQIETDPRFLELRSALYKELILHLTQGKPRTLFKFYLDDANFTYDYYKDIMKDPDPRSTLIGHNNIFACDVMEDAIKEVNKLTVL